MGSSLIFLKEEHSPWERGTNYKCTNLVLTKALLNVPSPVNPKFENTIHHQEEGYESQVFPFYTKGIRICYKEYDCLYRLL